MLFKLHSLMATRIRMSTLLPLAILALTGILHVYFSLPRPQPAHFFLPNQVCCMALFWLRHASSRDFGCINISFCKANNLPSSPIIPDYSLRTKGPLLFLRKIVPTMSDNSSAKSLADPALLETIDKLFQHNIGDYVSLPQVSL